WWGHRIPAWYCGDCQEITVSREDAESCAHCGSRDLHQETDVLDTWFSSALWPFSTMGWPDETETLKKFYPTSCLVTGFDILFFWVARMMMMGLKFMEDVPFREVYIHALVRDAQGQKMSKSRGNVIDPLLVIEEYGADAFRFTLASFAAMGRDVKLSTDRIAGYRNFCNKIWNASRFALMNLEDFEPAAGDLSSVALVDADRWVLTRLGETVDQVESSLAEYKFNEAAGSLYAFIWHNFCDWYIELVKDDLYGDDPEARRRAQTVLYQVLERLLRLLHPFMPFISEEIWQALPGRRPCASIMRAEFPSGRDLPRDPAGAERMELVMDVIRAIRNVRGEMNVPPSRQVAVLLECKSGESLKVLRDGEPAIRALGRVGELTIEREIERPGQTATQVVGDVEILLPLAGLVDIAEEVKRLEKEIAKVRKDVDFFTKKLSNEKFVANAPPQVLEKDRDKLADAEGKLVILRESLRKIQALKA
ncbi:MAG TPA: class I tRNA ligase family protein, partial [Desulfuromonadales bacterium]|nr:class I tRNA ligase family protein [Desulfuromonadales bacterium]